MLTVLGLSVREFVNWPGIGETGDGELPNQVVVPAHGEDPALVEATLRHLRGLAPDVPITVLSTDAQPRMSMPSKTSYLALSPSGSSKGALINKSISEGALGQGTLCIYDADSRPTSLCHNRLGSPLISQQLSVYAPSRGAWPGFWSGCATNQTAWALGYERRSLRSRNFYLIGHGLTLDVSYLAQTPFAEGVPGEDILLGYRAALNGITVAISPGLDVAEAPGGLREFLHQSGRWFMGEWCSLRAVTAPEGDHWRRLRLLGKRYAGLGFWLAGPPLVLVFGIKPAVSRARWALLSLILVRSGRWLATERIERRYRHISGHHLARFLGFNGKPLLAAFGAYWGVIRYGLTDRLSAMPKARTREDTLCRARI